MMTGRWHTPLDPNCPDNPLAGFYENPLTAESGCDEIAYDLERIHLAGCGRCQCFGGSTGPPRPKKSLRGSPGFLQAQQQPTFKERVAARQQARREAIDQGERPIATFAPGFRNIKLYADGRIESPFGSGSVIGATARVDQSGSQRILRNTRQTYITIEGPQVAIAQKLTSPGVMSINSARKFAAKVNQVGSGDRAGA